MNSTLPRTTPELAAALAHLRMALSHKESDEVATRGNALALA
jgi:hypothetical protein